MKKFLLGLIIGTSTLGLAVPLFALAASSSEGSESSSARAKAFNPSQVCVQALADRDQQRLSDMDAMLQVRKAALQTHKNALSAAAAIADDTQRKDAVQNANEAFHTSMRSTMEQRKDARTSTMEAVHTACGDDARMMGGGGFGFGRGGAGMMGRRGGMGMHKGEFKGAEDAGVSSRSPSAE